MTEHTHHHDEDSACAVAHSPVAPATSSVPAERTLVAVFASPVAGYLLRYAADMGFRGLLLEPDEARAAGAELVAGATGLWATPQAESSSWWCVCSVISLVCPRP